MFIRMGVQIYFIENSKKSRKRTQCVVYSIIIKGESYYIMQKTEDLDKIKRIKISEYLNMIKINLQRHFPETIFSLHVKSYTGGKSLKITWQGGPEECKLHKLREMYSGASIDQSCFKTKEYSLVSLPEKTMMIDWGFDYIIFCRK